MDSVMTHLQAAVAVGEEIVDRNPNFCLTSECASPGVGTYTPKSAR